MKAVKTEIENYFDTGWTETSIQFDGGLFPERKEQHPIDKRWVAISFIPIARSIYSTGNGRGRKRDTMQLKVISFDESPTLALGLEDRVRTFLECFKGQSSTNTKSLTADSMIYTSDNDIITADATEITDHHHSEAFDFYVGEGQPSGRGITPLDNGVYMSISLFKIVNYN